MHFLAASTDLTGILELFTNMHTLITHTTSLMMRFHCHCCFNYLSNQAPSTTCAQKTVSYKSLLVNSGQHDESY